ncbi:MAG: hypothetical protein Q4D65_01520, partial [Peptostreptococcaceae bacterium]|nr:hypothetical protein [Peptostreptococcaceae bacterium]
MIYNETKIICKTDTEEDVVFEKVGFEKKKVLKRIMAWIFVILLLIPNPAYATVDLRRIRLTVDNLGFFLPLKDSSSSVPTLPQGISWDQNRELLILDNYQGGSLLIEALAQRTLNELNIELRGENNIWKSSDSVGLGRNSINMLKLKGNGTLNVRYYNDNPNAPGGTGIEAELLLLENVKVNVDMRVPSGYLIGLRKQVEMRGNSKLSVNLQGKEVTGIYSGVQVLENSELDIYVKGEDAQGIKFFNSTNKIIMDTSRQVRVEAESTLKDAVAIDNSKLGPFLFFDSSAINSGYIQLKATAPLEKNAKVVYFRPQLGKFAYSLTESGVEKYANGKLTPPFQVVRLDGKQDSVEHNQSLVLGIVPQNSPFELLDKTFYNEQVDWSLSGNSSIETRIENGRLFIGQDERKGSFTVTARHKESAAQENIQIDVMPKLELKFSAGEGGKFQGEDVKEKMFRVPADTVGVMQNIVIPTPEANEGYEFLGWNPIIEAQTMSFRRDERPDFRAEFRHTNFYIENQMPAELDIRNLPRNNIAHFEDNVNFEIVPKDERVHFVSNLEIRKKSNQELIKRISNKDSGVLSGSFKMPADDVIITVTSDKILYKIEAEKVSGADIRVKDSSKSGDIVSVDISLDEKIHLLKEITAKRKSDDRKLNLTPVDTQNGRSASFIMPADDVTIGVSLDKKAYTITKQEVNGVTIQAPESFKNGEKVQVFVNSNDPIRYEVTDIVVTQENGNVVEPLEKIGGNTQFTMPTANVNVTAKVKYQIDTSRIPPQDAELTDESKSITKAFANEKVKIDLKIKKPKLKAIESIVVNDGGNHVISVKYLNNEKTSAEFVMPQDYVSVNVNFLDKPIVVKEISDVRLAKKDYAAGEELSINDMTAIIHLTDDTSKSIGVQDFSTNQIEMVLISDEGAQEQSTVIQARDKVVLTKNHKKIVLKSNGKMVEIPLTVGEAKVNNLSIEGDFKKNYAEGEQIDFENAKLVIRKTDGSEEKVSLNALSNEYTISPNRPTGLQKSDTEIVITHTATKTIYRIPITVGDAKVNNLSIEGDFKKNYAAGESIDFENAKLVIRKTDGSEEKVSLNALSNEYTISPNRPTGLQK